MIRVLILCNKKIMSTLMFGIEKEEEREKKESFGERERGRGRDI